MPNTTAEKLSMELNNSNTKRYGKQTSQSSKYDENKNKKNLKADNNAVVFFFAVKGAALHTFIYLFFNIFCLFFL